MKKIVLIYIILMENAFSWHPFYSEIRFSWDFLSKRIMVDALLVNRCMQPGSFARNRLYSNLHVDPPSPRIPVPWLPAGCCIDWSTYTYLRHKMFRHKGEDSETYDTRALQRSSISVPAVGINLHFVILTFRIFRGGASLRYERDVTLRTSRL